MTRFNRSVLTDPEVFSVNRLPAHSDHCYYTDARQALESGSMELCHSLDGDWRFFYSPAPALIPAGFEAADFCCDGWDTIRVPGHMELQGYGRPQYVNVQYPWDGHQALEPGQLPEENPTGCYVRDFTVPAQWKDGPVFLSFQGVASACAVWLNGVYLGYAEDSFTPHEFHLTDALREGKNRLAVQVFKWCSGSWMEDQDYWRVSGIFRSVLLYTVPRAHISDLFVKAEPGENGTGKLSASLALSGAYEGCMVSVSLYDDEDSVISGPVEVSAAKAVELALEAAEVKLWSAEEPNLYCALFTIIGADGAVVECVPQKVGFRHFAMENGLMKLNGKRIVFKGVNRHEFSSRHGRAVTQEEMLWDIKTMKRHNINAVRTSHYPNNSAFYTLCDEYGLYVIDETNLETHGTVELEGHKMLPDGHPEWREASLDRARSMLERDKNHPCVLIWSCGNESGGGETLYRMSEFFRERDNTRLVHYEGVSGDRRFNGTSDMESQMYTKVAEIEEFLKKDRSKPFICCEYAHAMGNSCGALHKYTELAESEPLYQGGFIWDYIDQAILTRTESGEEYLAYGGDFSDRPTDGAFCGNGVVFADRTLTPKMQEVKFCYQDILLEPELDCVRITNRSLFRSTWGYELRLELLRDGNPVRHLSVRVDVAPGECKEIPRPFEAPSEPGEYTVNASLVLALETAWAERGHEVAFGQMVYRVSGGQAAEKSPVHAEVGMNNLGISGEGFRAIFDKEKGNLVSYCFAGRELLETVPVPNFWRAPTDNDKGNKAPRRYAQWKLASQYAKATSFAWKLEDGRAIVTVHLDLCTTPASACVVTYTVSGDGTVEVALDYEGVKGMSELFDFGMLLRLPVRHSFLRYYGYGPEENYADRRHGARLGIFETDSAANMTRYLVPQECGNRTGVRWAEVTDTLGRGLRFTAEEGMDFSALPYTPFEVENARHAYALPKSSATVVRLSSGQCGVGGDDSWGAPVHEEYRLCGEKAHHFCFTFQGISGHAED